MSEIAEGMAAAWDEGWTARFEMDTYGGHKHNPYSCGLCKESEAQTNPTAGTPEDAAAQLDMARDLDRALKARDEGEA